MIPKFLKQRKAPQCLFTVIVVAYDMARELPRTLHSLSRQYQQRCEGLDYEVIVVDNGSPEPVEQAMVSSYGPEFRLLRIESASPSPSAGINKAAAIASGSNLAIMVDGARILSPGILWWAAQAYQLQSRAVVSVLGFHLGPEHQSQSSQRGYSQAVEDQLLERIAWPQDGHKLFEIAALAGSANFGWYGSLAESNCVFVPASLYRDLGGYEERFVSPGGGLVNLDFYKRACEAEDVELFYLVGEGCFHQTHGGVTTGGEHENAATFDQLQHEYQAIRGSLYSKPTNAPILLGHSRLEATWLVNEASGQMVTELQLDRLRSQHMQAVGLDYQFHDESKYADL